MTSSLNEAAAETASRPSRQVDEAIAVIRRSVLGPDPLAPRVGVVLGSGLAAFGDAIENATRIPYAEIPHFPRPTAEGHKGELVLGQVAGVPVAVMSGRVHFYEGYSEQQVVHPVRVLGRLGVSTIVLTNAAGAVNRSYRPGDFMILSDHLNLTGRNPLLGPNDPELGPRFPDLSQPYDRALLGQDPDRLSVGSGHRPRRRLRRPARSKLRNAGGDPYVQADGRGRGRHVDRP